MIVVHRNHQIEVTSPSTEEDGIGRERPLHVDAGGLGGAHGRRDLLLLLATAEKTVLTGVRVDATHCDAWRGDARRDEGVVSAADRSLD